MDGATWSIVSFPGRDSLKWRALANLVSGLELKEYAKRVLTKEGNAADEERRSFNLHQFLFKPLIEKAGGSWQTLVPGAIIPNQGKRSSLCIDTLGISTVFTKGDVAECDGMTFKTKNGSNCSEDKAWFQLWFHHVSSAADNGSGLIAFHEGDEDRDSARWGDAQKEERKRIKEWREQRAFKRTPYVEISVNRLLFLEKVFRLFLDEKMDRMTIAEFYEQSISLVDRHMDELYDVYVRCAKYGGKKTIMDEEWARGNAVGMLVSFYSAAMSEQSKVQEAVEGVKVYNDDRLAECWLRLGCFGMGVLSKQLETVPLACLKKALKEREDCCAFFGSRGVLRSALGRNLAEAVMPNHRC